MSVDMHEGKFRQRLAELEPFLPTVRVPADVRAADFPAWRAFFSAQLLFCHSTGYRLPSYADFEKTCRSGFARHQDRYREWLDESKWPETRQRIRSWYASGICEAYVYVCLTDVFEDILRDGVVLYDSRVDWKQKCDVVVARSGHVFAVSVFFGSSLDRDGVEWRRGKIERRRKQNTSHSSHWGNREREGWEDLRIAVDDDCQVVNGVRLPSISEVNRALSAIYARSGSGDFLWPEAVSERDAIYKRLIGRQAALASSRAA